MIFYPIDIFNLIGEEFGQQGLRITIRSLAGRRSCVDVSFNTTSIWDEIDFVKLPNAGIDYMSYHRGNKIFNAFKIFMKAISNHFASVGNLHRQSEATHRS